MKPLLLNTFDIRGGAARAAYRLHTGLKNSGIESQMLVQIKMSTDCTVIGPKTKIQNCLGMMRMALDSLSLQYLRKTKDIFSLAILPNNITTKIKNLNPDIINLHWIAGGFLKPETFNHFNKPLIWTLHDMWAFTGGCHYDQECGRYRESCGKCPVLGSGRKNDISHKIWKRKYKAWSELDITIVTPSRWLAQCARESSLFSNYRIEVIPYGLDLSYYKPINKQVARKLLSLPQDKKLILFGAMGSTSDKRKGFQFLQPALHKLAADEWDTKAKLVIFGASKPRNSPNLGLKAYYFGHVKNDNLILLYSAADVFVAPSIQDNLPNTIMEALACGTPCVAFNIGGMPDMIEHHKTGYLAKPFETDDLARGIAWVIEDENRRQILSQQAREKVEKSFNIESMAQQYIELYNEILGR